MARAAGRPTRDTWAGRFSRSAASSRARCSSIPLPQTESGVTDAGNVDIETHWKDCTLQFLGLAVKFHLAVVRLNVLAPYTPRKLMKLQKGHRKKAMNCPSPSRQLLPCPLGCLGCRLVPCLASDNCISICPGLLPVGHLIVRGHVCRCCICMAAPFPLLLFRQWQLFSCRVCIGRHCFPLLLPLLPRLQAGCRCPVCRTCRRNSMGSLLVSHAGHTARQSPDTPLAPAG